MKTIYIILIILLLLVLGFFIYKSYASKGEGQVYYF
jgi:hypothetical protein